MLSSTFLSFSFAFILKSYAVGSELEHHVLIYTFTAMVESGLKEFAPPRLRLCSCINS